MTQKLTQIIVSPETAVFPIQTKRERLFHVWVARNKKAARTRSRQKLARATNQVRVHPKGAP